ncbi:integumentary mucin C.1-like [Lytechinus pictus]|uniref:integumentary mucin C.1-like n=1 Tax=Lytechinus pictus TaxID=7653 RepID=UPI0030B9BDB0
MARITIFRAAGILVVALLCGTEVQFATGITTTDVPTTTSILTTGPTTAPIPTTTGPTTAPIPTTTGPTTATKPTTTAAATTVNSTTEPTNTTTGNMTTALSNMTTTINNMTTTITNMTTSSGGTTSVPKAQWQVKDKDGKLCILMDFGGTITEVTRKNTVNIPPDAHVSGNCSSPSHSAFFLYFSEGSGLSEQIWSDLRHKRELFRA